MTTVAIPNLTGDAIHGYGVIVREYAQALSSLNQRGLTDWRHTALHEFADIRLMFIPPKPWLFSGRRRVEDMVLHTMYEAEPLPPYFPQILNLATAIWTPSTYCRDLFRSEGVTTPIISSGYGVNPRYWYPPAKREPTEGRRLRVGVLSNVLVSRKNALPAIQAFHRVNHGRAVLEVKLNAGPPVNLMDNDTRSVPTDITVFSEDWDIIKLSNWVRSLDLLLHPTTGEGFGLPVLEAMACGVVPIVPNHTGLSDFVSDQTCFILPHRGLEEAWSLNQLYAASSYWRAITKEDIEETLDFALGQPSLIEEKSQAAVEYTSGLTWDLSLLNAIQQLDPIFRR